MTSERTSAVEKTSSGMTTPPGRTVLRSWCQVAGLNATRMSTLSERAMWPSGVTRSWYQVGRPSMLEGKTFLGATGMPIWKIALVKTRFAVWLPEPLTVAAWMVRSLMICCVNFVSLYCGLRILRVCSNQAVFLTVLIGEGRHTERAGRGRTTGCAGPRHGGQAPGSQARGQRGGWRWRRRF